AALVVAAALVAVIAIRIEALPLFLAATIFLEDTAVGGLTVGRIAGALALVAIVYYLLANGSLSLQMTPLLAVSGAYGFWILLSASWASSASDVYSTFFGFLLVMAYMLTFGMLVTTPRAAANVLLVLVVGATLSGLVAVNTYLVTGGAERATGFQGAAHA